MCGGGGGGGQDPVDYQRQQEAERQRRIEEGRQQLEHIFLPLEGKSFQQRLDMIAGKDVKPIWEQQQDAYLDFAKPQLEDQYADAREQLGYALARQGQGASSLSGDRFSDLERDYSLRLQDVTDKARGYSNDAKQNIADQKQSLLTMLESTANPNTTMAAARSKLNSLQATPSFSSLGPLFQNTTAGLAGAMQGNQNYQNNQRMQQIVYGGDPDTGSGRVVR